MINVKIDYSDNIDLRKHIADKNDIYFIDNSIIKSRKQIIDLMADLTTNIDLVDCLDTDFYHDVLYYYSDWVSDNYNRDYGFSEIMDIFEHCIEYELDNLLYAIFDEDYHIGYEPGKYLKNILDAGNYKLRYTEPMYESYLDFSIIYPSDQEVLANDIVTGNGFYKLSIEDTTGVIEDYFTEPLDKLYLEEILSKQDLNINDFNIIDLTGGYRDISAFETYIIEVANMYNIPFVKNTAEQNNIYYLDFDFRHNKSRIINMMNNLTKGISLENYLDDYFFKYILRDYIPELNITYAEGEDQLHELVHTNRDDILYIIYKYKPLRENDYFKNILDIAGYDILFETELDINSYDDYIIYPNGKEDLAEDILTRRGFYKITIKDSDYNILGFMEDYFPVTIDEDFVSKIIEPKFNLDIINFEIKREY